MGDAPKPAPRSRRRTILLVAVLVAVILAVVTAAATLYTEVLWFRELRHANVFWTSFWTRLGLGAVFGALFALVLGSNLWIVRRITPPERVSKIPVEILSRYRATLKPYKYRAFAALGTFGGLLAGMRVASKWREYLLWGHAQTMGATEPVFGKDAGFYVFKLPFLRAVFGWTFASLLAVTILVVIAHYFRGGIRPQRRGDRVGPEARAHLSILIGLLALLKAWGYRLDMFGLLSSYRGVVSGAGYTDVHAKLPALKVLFVVAIVAAVLLLANARSKGWRLPVGALVLLVGVSFVAGGVYPGLVQRLKVKPDERTLEQPYIQRNIDATRLAYGVDSVASVPYQAAGTLEARDVAPDVDTISNIRVWAPDVLQAVYLNLQRGKQYYQFPSPADTDRYPAGGGDARARQLMIAAREISPSGLSPDAQTWVNTHLFYTHGYGVVASRADDVVGGGAPDFVLRDIPTQPSQGAPQVSEQQVYFGEKAEIPFVIARTRHGELDHPSEDENGVGYATTTYDGTGGIPMDGFLKRAALAWRFRDLNVLISGAISDESRFMFRRQIVKRVSTVAPFLQIDGNPYIAVADGRLVWILDGYTTSNTFPYSQPSNFAGASAGLVGGTGNYIRNSVKFVVDAKNGTVDAYAWDEQDPVLKAWIEIFPGLFKPRTELPSSVLPHVRYPEGYFQVQSNTFANYHVTDAGSFYQKEDAWLVARDPTYCLNLAGACKASTTPPAMPAYYMLARLPGTSEARFVLVRPFTPGGAGRQNMVGYLAANGDPSVYGRLVVYEFPRSGQVFGPEQVEANINQDPAVSQQIALWNQQHSKVIYGNLVIVPIGDTMLYVQPLYLRGEGSQIPELKRVVVVANGRVEMADTLPDALAQLLATPAP
jgi:uncharacterized protein